MCVSRLNKQIGWQYTVFKGSFDISKITFFFWPVCSKFDSWMKLIDLLDKFVKRFFTMFHPPKKNVVNTPPPNTGFLFKFTLNLFLWSCRKKYCIWWSKPSVNCRSANFFVSFIRKFKNFIYYSSFYIPWKHPRGLLLFL